MMAMALVLVCAAAFAALALGMDRHAREVLGAAPSAGRRVALRVAGWGLLACALLISVAGWGRSVGLVEWLAVLTFAAVPLVMLVLPHFAGRRAVVSPRKPTSAVRTAEAWRSLPWKLWRALHLTALLALPLFMLWAFMQAQAGAA